MGRPKVPHCKECSQLRGYPTGYFGDSLYGCWSCLALGKRPISGQEVRTSPLWCPLRQLQKDAKT